jgi:hypothetical protein
LIIAESRHRCAAAHSCISSSLGHAKLLFDIRTSDHTRTPLWKDGGILNGIIKGNSISGLSHPWPSVKGLDGGKTLFNATPDDIVHFFEAHPFM